VAHLKCSVADARRAEGDASHISIRELQRCPHARQMRHLRDISQQLHNNATKSPASVQLVDL
jgi:hypothetical protein